MVDWREYQYRYEGFRVESIDWVFREAFNTEDHEHPRVLLIGDSICYQNRSTVMELLYPDVTVTSWSSAKFGLHPTYLAELSLVLDEGRYDMVCFNNGLHSLSAPTDAWKKAYDGVVRYLLDRLPGVPVSIVLSTPITAPRKDAVPVINQMTLDVAGKYRLAVVDLYTPMMEEQMQQYRTDDFHWGGAAIQTMAGILNAHIRARLGVGGPDAR